MSSTYTARYGLERPATGQQGGLWGNTVNNAITSLIDEAIDAVSSVAMANTDQTLTIPVAASSPARAGTLRCTGTLTADRTLTVPAGDRVVRVLNATTGGFSILVRNPTSTTIAVPAGSTVTVAFTGSTASELVPRIQAPIALAGSTTTPILTLTQNGAGAALETNGSIFTSSFMRAGSGTAASPGFAFFGDFDTGVFRPAANQLSISTSGVERLTVREDGRIGVGNTSPGTTLAVNGTFNATGASTVGGTLGVTGATTLSSTLAVTGASTFSAAITGLRSTFTAATEQVTLVKTLATGQRCIVRGQLNGVDRWYLDLADDQGESGLPLEAGGSALRFYRFRNDGGFLGIPFQIFRDTGISNFTTIGQGGNRPTFEGNNAGGLFGLARLSEAWRPRNRIVNPSMRWDQEREGTALTLSTGAGFIADQWRMGLSTTPGGQLQGQRISLATPGGSPNRLRFTVIATDGSLGGSDFYIVDQPIEGTNMQDARFGAGSARQLVLRIGVRSSIPGIFGVSLMNAASTFSWVGTFEILAGQVGVDQVRDFIIPPQASGVWASDNTAFGFLRISLASASSSHGVAGWNSGNFLTTSSQTNFMNNPSATFDLFDVGLYVELQAAGSAVGIAPAWELPDLNEELRVCQRYYEKSYPAGVASGSAGAPNGAEWLTTPGGGNWRNSWAFLVPKRSIPGVSVFSPVTGALGVRDLIANVDRGTAVSGVSTIGFSVADAPAIGTLTVLTAQFAASARL